MPSTPPSNPSPDTPSVPSENAPEPVTVSKHATDDQAQGAAKQREEIVGELDRLKIESFPQNNLLGNIVVTEAENIQQMMGLMASRFDEMSEGMIKELKNTIVKEMLENFLSSSDRIDSRTQNGQSQHWAPFVPY